MEHSEIILIALILLVIFAGVQIKNFFSFLKGNAPVKEERSEPMPLKTVLPATEAVVLKKKKTVAKKATSFPKKKVVKKSPATKKKNTTKKKA